MRTVRKRLLALLLTLVMVVSLFPVTALADEDEDMGTIAPVEEDTPAEDPSPAEEPQGSIAPAGEVPEAVPGTTPEALPPEPVADELQSSGSCGSNLTWSFSGGVLTISGTGSMTDYGSAAVGSSRTAAPWDNLAVKSLVVNSGVTSIGNTAFLYNNALETVELPNTLTRIGGGAFFKLPKLRKVNIPSSVTEVGNLAFAQCDMLETAGPAGGNYNVEIGWTGSIPASAFLQMSLTRVVLPKSISSIGMSAFEKCTKLSSVILPDSMTSIGISAFSGCTSLSSVTLPTRLSEFGARAFQDCTSLQEVWLPTGMQTLGSYAFSGCTALQTVVFRDSCKQIGTYAFSGCSSLSEVGLPSDLEEICIGAFADCPNLSLSLPASLRRIESKAFRSTSGSRAQVFRFEGTPSYLGNNLFSESAYTHLYFFGGAPSFSASSFQNATVAVHYPAVNASWTAAVRQDYGGSATWIPFHIYTIRYDANGGSGGPTEEQSKIENEPLRLATERPKRSSESLGSYTVTLDPNGGSVAQTSLSAARTRNYAFSSWNTAPDGSGTSYSPGATYTSNASVTLYADWEATDEVETLDLPTPTRTGYRFLGWASSANASSGISGNYCPTGNVKLYAVWSLNTYTIDYSANGGTGAPSSQTKIHGQDLRLSQTVPVRAGHRFLGWGIGWDASTVFYQPGDLYTKDESQTLIAVWEQTEFTVSYDAKGGNGAPESQIKRRGVDISLSETAPSRYGYQFLGWSTSSNSSTVSYLPGDLYTKDADLKLYAVWKANTYTITFDANGGRGAPQPQTKTHDSSLIIPSEKPVRDDEAAGEYTVTLDYNDGSGTILTHTASITRSFRFDCWTTEADGSGSRYYPGNYLKLEGDRTLYALWSSSLETESVTLEEPVRDHYIFKGWGSTPTGGIVVSVGSGSYVPTKDITLYALWEKESFTVSYYANGGIGAPSSQTKLYGEDLVLSTTIPTYEKYLFTGWATDKDAVEAVYQPGDLYREERSVTLYAVWVKDCPVAGSGSCGESVDWTLYTDGELWITGQGPMTDYLYSDDTPFYSPPAEITSVKICNGVTSIGRFVFYDCSSIKYVSMPSTVTSIGERAFANCSGLTRISIPYSVRSIGQRAFYGCSGLADSSGYVIICNTLFLYCGTASDVSIPSEVTRIDGYAFLNNTTLVSVTLPANLGEINVGAFANCTALTRVTIPAKVRVVGERAFSGCTALTNVTFLSSAAEIGKEAFLNCSALQTLTLPSSNMKIGPGAFRGCKRLPNSNGFIIINNILFDYVGTATQVAIPETVTRLDPAAFQKNDKITNISIPGSISAIGSWAFSYCTALKDVSISVGVTAIDEYAFFGCSALTRVTLPDGLNTIGEYAFSKCVSLPRVDLPAGLKSICPYVFSECSGLSQVSFPVGLEDISACAFSSCTALTEAVLPEGLRTIGRGAFQSCKSLASVSFPEELTSIGSDAFNYCTALTSVTVPNLVSTIGMKAFIGCKSLQTVYLGDAVRSIGNEAFKDCSALTEVRLPDGLSTIGERAFYGCTALSRADLPAGLTSLGPYAFYKCEKLERAVIPSGVREIQEDAFSKCTSLAEVTFCPGLECIGKGAFSSCTGLERILLPDTLTTLSQYAFYSCSGLKLVNLPQSVLTIPDYAFGFCNALKRVVYSGSEEQRSALEIGSNNDPLRKATWYCGTKLVPVQIDPPAHGSLGVDLALLGRTLIDLTISADPGYRLECFTVNGREVDPETYTVESAEELVLGARFVKIYPEKLLTNGGSCGPRTSWSLYEDGTLFISGSGKTDNFSVSDASRYVPWKNDTACITTVEIAEGVTGIGQYAFNGLTAMTDLRFPESLEAIDDYACTNCSALQILHLPQGVKRIGKNAFPFGNRPIVLYAGTEEQKAQIELSSLSSQPWYFQPEIVPFTLQQSEHGTVDLFLALRGESLVDLVLCPDPGYRVESMLVNGVAVDWENYTVGEEAELTISARFVESYPDKTFVTGGLCGPGTSWALYDDGLLYISGLGGMHSFSSAAAVPWKSNLSAVTRLVVEEGVTELGAYLFQGSTKLTELIFPESLTSIGSYAFSNCSQLKEVHFPDGLHHLADHAFSGCTGLTELELPSGYRGSGQYAFSECSGLVSLTVREGATGIGSFDFQNCTQLCKVTLPSSLVRVKGFTGCTALTELELPEGLTSIGALAFSECSELTSLSIPSTVTEILGYAFRSCAKLELSALPPSVEHIGSYAFYGCSNLTVDRLPESLEEVGPYAFYNCRGLKADALPAGLTSIGSYAFYNCFGLKADALPAGLTGIGSYAFYNCDGLTIDTIPEGVTSIEDFAFDGCSGITKLMISEGVLTIGQYAFSNCSNLEEVQFPESVTKLVTYAFSSCRRLKKIVFLGSAPEIGSSAFSSVTATVYYPATDSSWTSDTRQHYGGTLTWKAFTPYKILFDGNGGDGVPAAQTKIPGETLVLPKTVPTRADSVQNVPVTLDPNDGSGETTVLNAEVITAYSFLYWNTQADGDGFSFRPGGNYTRDEAATLYAQWSSSVRSEPVTLPTPEREGCVFLGWSTDREAAEGISGAYTPDGPVTLYALWKELPNGIFQLSDAMSKPGKEITVTVTMPENPGLYSLTAHVSYDRESLSFLGVENGVLSGWSCNVARGILFWSASSSADLDRTGEILKLRFRILEEAAEGVTSVSLDELEAYNAEGEDVYLRILPASVSIVGRVPGDVDGNCTVDLLDLVRLRKYLMQDTQDIDSSSADITGDSKVNAQDLLLLRKYLVGDPTAILS